MTTREELFEHFGPILIEAIVLVIKDEVNLLRGEAGWPERTNEQILNAVATKLAILTKYAWMNREL